MTTKTYDPIKVVVTVGSHTISGYGENSLVKCERNEDGFKLQVGGSGEAVRSRNPNRSGKITITLLQSSISNEYLSAMANLDESGVAGAVAAPNTAPTAGVLPVTVKDTNGNTIWSAEEAWIVKPPAADLEKEAKEREWTFETAFLRYSERGL
jgi:hypothetical protein